MPELIQPMRAANSSGEVLRVCRLGMACVGIMLGTLAGNARADDEDWSVASRSAEVTVYQRTRKGSALKEFKAVGLLDAPPEVIKRVIDDVGEYPRFMPYVSEARVLARDAGSQVSYQRLSPPLISDLDYTVRVRSEAWSTPGGKAFRNRWVTANDLGPAAKAGVKRVKITEGSWLLEPEEGGRKTRATYLVFSDSGSAMPTAITNTASRSAIPKLFKAVLKQAQLPKYLRLP